MSRADRYADLARAAGQSVDENGGSDCPLCGYWMKVAHGFECTGCGRARGTTSVEIEQALTERAEARGGLSATRSDDWLEGAPMDPAGVPTEPLPTVPGFPFAYSGGASAIGSGPTGTGRSALFQACAYDGTEHGLRTGYLSAEVGEGEFNARAADLARRRGDTVDDALRHRLALVRYLDLSSVMAAAWLDPGRWLADSVALFDVVIVDPLSAVAAALGLDFDKSNADYVCFHEALVQPLASAGLLVVMAENIGHDQDARNRAKGASAKQDRADITFACKPKASPLGLVITAGKVRSVRAPFRRGDSWVFDRESQLIRAEESTAPGEAFRPTALMQRLSEAIEASPGMTARDVRSVKGNNDWLKEALRFLLDEGYVRVEPDGKAQRHYSDRPYRSESDGAHVPNRAHDVPTAHAEALCAHVPTPLEAQGTGHTNGYAESERERLEAKGLAPA